MKMNIFVLSECPTESAEMMVDKHVVKMPTESMQMKCTIANLHDYQTPFAPVMLNHPCTIWARESQENYEWLIDHAYAMCQEYTRRYGKVHKSIYVIEWCGKNYHRLNLPKIGLTPFAQAMPEEYKNDCAIKAYRAYYNGEKAYFATWKTRKTPEWFEPVK